MDVVLPDKLVDKINAEAKIELGKKFSALKTKRRGQ